MKKPTPKTVKKRCLTLELRRFIPGEISLETKRTLNKKKTPKDD